MYYIRYNNDMKKYGVYCSNPNYSYNLLLCAIFDSYEEAVIYIVNSLKNKK